MMEAVLLVLGSVLGYFGHVGQAAYNRKHQKRDEQVAAIKTLHGKLLVLYDFEGKPLDAREPARQALADVVMLRDAKLRERVTADLDKVGELFSIRLGPNDPVETRQIWIQDALDCLAAAARGDRLPELSVEFEHQLFFLEREQAELEPSLKSLMETLQQAVPEVANVSADFEAWRKSRRSKQGWRRVLFWRK